MYTLRFYKFADDFRKAPQYVADFNTNSVPWDEVEKAVLVAQNVMDGVSMDTMSMDDFKFFLESHDGKEVYLREDLNSWKLIKMRMVNETLLMQQIDSIENFAGSAYQSNDEVDIALIAIRAELGCPRK